MQPETSSQIDVLEYRDWVKSQQFADSQEHRQYISRETENFLECIIYPMFYDPREEFHTPYPFPLVLKGSRRPKFVIENDYFSIVLFFYKDDHGATRWEVSFHVKSNDYCDSKIADFAKWYRIHHTRSLADLATSMPDMPKKYRYESLDIFCTTAKDFSIEFDGVAQNYLLYKLMDCLRIY